MMFPLRDRIVVILSLAIQFPLAVLFGHYYDDRIFLATGYLVANGQNPYQAQDLSGFFHSSIFQGITTIGYPPPWALVLGIMYRLANGISANLFVYNFAIKLPIIAANIGIAYLAGAILARMGADESASRNARVLLLLNPFLFYFGTAWGQFDVIVAVFSLMAMMLLKDQKLGWSALALALAVSFKPTAIPILCVFWIYWMGKSFWHAVRFLAFFIAGIIVFCILPFPVFGWDPTPILAHWNYHFTVAGGMSPMAIYSLFHNSGQLTGAWQLLGWVWIPALVLGMMALRNRLRGAEDVLRASAAIVLIFFLTRSWLSEPNVILIVPLAVMLACVGRISSRALAAVWILPFVFTALNNSIPQLLFPILFGSMPALMQSNGEFRTVLLCAQVVIIVLWQIAGWRMIERCLPRNQEQ